MFGSSRKKRHLNYTSHLDSVFMQIRVVLYNNDTTKFCFNLKMHLLWLERIKHDPALVKYDLANFLHISLT